mgnify:CR=1 FL=1
MHKSHRTHAARKAQKAARIIATNKDRALAAIRKGTDPSGYHLTWTGSGGTCSGYVFNDTPGYYPGENGNADCVVAPVKFVERYAVRVDPLGQYPETAADAVRAYARAQGWPCG